ncbi:ferric reductase-like transmembrane domain-containing protein [Allonocardiopsis opalescens]|uniref:Ferric reductase like protein n=1 Tax=Allonocardiopsis opalescens TaxID=1144618 RepID=A0A2T0QEV7_9ACTN|nr:ferric reductase-like transmembrane domain-containing protein [Allonocardiopsis opalescens]PRY02467.1 ferric reductase like protein [Allonocardiopsis opalescens]
MSEVRNPIPGDSAAESAPPRKRRGRRIDLAGFAADLRGAVPDASAALVITGLIFWWLYSRVAAGVSQTVQVMPFLADANQYWVYWLCQAFGWSALLWAWITVMLGLIRSSTLPGWMPFSAARIERLHRTTSLTTIALMFAHALAFFVELVRANDYELPWGGRVLTAFVESFVPGGYPSGTGQVAILVGLLAFYLAIPLGLAYYVRQATGSRMWRALHRLIIVVYALSVWHTLLYGTSVWFDGWLRTGLWLLQLPVAALLLARLLAPARSSERLRLSDPAVRERPLISAARLGARLATAATIVVLLLVAASGRDGGRLPGAESVPVNTPASFVWAGLAVLLVVAGVVVHTTRVRRRERRASGPVPG